jgi:hypothetical protein
MSHNPTEHVHEETIHHVAHGHGDGGGHASQWITAAALTAAILAAFAAITGALATRHLTESTHKRIESNDKWSYFQSKSLKNYLLDTKDEILQGMGREVPKGDLKKIEENNLEKKQTKQEAEALEVLSKAHLEAHETFELAATMFHIAIAIVAISVVAKRKLFWYVSMGSGLIGMYFFCRAFTQTPAEHESKHEAPVTHSTSAAGAEHAVALPPGGGHSAAH